LDWPTHKLLCKYTSTDFTDKKRPVPAYIRGIYFAEDEERSRLVWLYTTQDADGYYGVDVSAVVANTTGIHVERRIKDSVPLHRSIGKAIIIAFRCREV
jgi:hypothetical protein